MLRRGFFTKLDELRHRDEEGAALVSIVILSFVMLIIVSSLSMTLVNAANLTADNKSSVKVLASAESGIDQAVFAATSNECLPTSKNDEYGYDVKVYRSASETKPTGLGDPTLSPGCPQDGDKYITIASKGKDARGEEIEVVSTYLWLERQVGAAEGAIVSGMGELNISSLDIINTESDVLIGTGNFNCNNSSTIAGDVIVLNGTVQLSNSCQVKGSIYASGDIRISNNAVGVGGNIYTNGNFEQNAGPLTQGSVYARGTIRFTSGARISGSIVGTGNGSVYLDRTEVGGSISTNAPVQLGNGTRIEGSVITSNNAALSMYDVRVKGDIRINGRFEQLQLSNVGGNVSSAASGQENRIAPDAIIGGSLTLAGTLSTWESGPKATGGIKTNQTVPSVGAIAYETPAELSGKFFKWRDYAFDENDWYSNGYQIVKKTGACDYQNTPALVNEINSFDVPTLVDLRDCVGGVQMYARNFTIKTDVTLLFKADGSENIQNIAINSADGANHDFNFYIPDNVKDGTPSCGLDPTLSQIDIYELKMGPKISGTIYSPCKVRFGGNSIINGQVYSGSVEYAGGGSSKLYYSQINLPGFPIDETAPVKSGFDADATERALPTLVARQEN